MSRNPNNLPVDRKSAKKYIEYLLNIDLIKDVYIKGSRSPLTDKTPHKESDWDLEAIVEIDNLFISRPRNLGILNADLHIVKKPSSKSVHWSEIFKN